MKHLFYIHSYITYFVSIEVAKYLKVNPDDCVFAYGRGFRPVRREFNCLEVDVPFTHHPVNTFAITRQFWRGWKKLRELDRFINSLVHDHAFHVYTNQTGIDFIRLFISHRQCTGFSLLEEGMYSYYTLEHINTVLCPPVGGRASLFYKFLIFLNYCGRLSEKKLFLSPDYSRAYGLTKESFPGYERKVQLELCFDQYALSQDNSITHVLALDSFADYGIVKWNVYEAAIQKIFLYLHQKKISNLWVKYNPEQYVIPEHRVRLKELFERFRMGINVKELPQSQSLELLAANSVNQELTFYVFLSSVGLYAAFCNKKVYSFANFIATGDAAYMKRVNELPEVFKEKVEFVQEPVSDFSTS